MSRFETNDDTSQKKSQGYFKKLEYKKIEPQELSQKAKASASQASHSFLKYLPMIVTILLLGASIGVIALTPSSLDQLSKQIAKEEAAVQALQTDVKALQEQDAQTVTELESLANSAADAGRAVAELQNKYALFNIDMQADLIRNNADAIGAYMGDDSKNEQVVWFSVDAIDAKPMWQFMTTYSFSGDQADAVWQCIDDQGFVYAYATGVYQVSKNQFFNVSHHLTSVGRASIKSTVENDYQSHLDILIDSINVAGPSDNPVVTVAPGVKDQIDAARQAAKASQNPNR